MFNVHTGRFSPQTHHKGWFKYYRFGKSREICLGERWIIISWEK